VTDIQDRTATTATDDLETLFATSSASPARGAARRAARASRRPPPRPAPSAVAPS
jgi:hypothetical protein